MSGAAFDTEAQKVLAQHITSLERLSFGDAAALPEASGAKVSIAGHECQVTTFVQPLRADAVLVTLQVARPGLLGVVSYHTERGLIFSADGSVCEATAEELQNNGG